MLLGRVVGATKVPSRLIFPVDAFPPSTPLTRQTNLAPGLPLVAKNLRVSPARMLAFAGLTVTTSLALFGRRGSLFDVPGLWLREETCALASCAISSPNAIQHETVIRAMTTVLILCGEKKWIQPAPTRKCSPQNPSKRRRSSARMGLGPLVPSVNQSSGNILNHYLTPLDPGFL